MKYILLLLWSCGSDVSIMKNNNVANDSTITETNVTAEPTEEPANEPGPAVPPDEIEGVGGYVHYYLRQLACPA